MINYREMPYVRQLAIRIASDFQITVADALTQIDAMAYNEVVNIWNYYFNSQETWTKG